MARGRLGIATKVIAKNAGNPSGYWTLLNSRLATPNLDCGAFPPLLFFILAFKKQKRW
jgi:hypothetical protein